MTSQSVVIRPSGGQLLDRLAEWLRSYRAAVGNHRGCDPRQGAVERRDPRAPTEVVALLRAAPIHRVVGRGGVLFVDTSAVAFDRFEHEHRLPAMLRMRWSWPAIPMWMAVSEQAHGTCALRLSLRRRHRVRYPSRYFHVAHSILDEVAQGLSAL